MATITDTIQIIIDAEDRASKEFNVIGAAVTALVATVSVAAIKDFAGDLLESAKRAEDLRTGLEFAAGGAEEATRVFAELRSISKQTGTGVSDLTDSWVRLKNLGLTPSREALLAYIDVAAGTRGKSAIDFVEAVADAITGEFERLKEFGIKASVLGDDVTLKFKGNAVTVKNDAKSIEDALVKIGQTEFAGAAAASAENLSKMTDRLLESIDRLKSKLAEDSGLVEGTKGIVRGLTELSDALADPPEKITFLSHTFDTASTAVSALANPFSLLKTNLGDVGEAAGTALSGVASGVRELRGVGDELGAVAEPIRELTAEQMALVAATDETAGAFDQMMFGATGADAAFAMASMTADEMSAAIKRASDEEKKNAKAAKEAQDATQKYALELAKLDAEIQKAKLEAYVTIKTTQLETDAERVKATFDSIDNSISNTGDLLGSLFDSLSTAGSLRDKWLIEDQIDLENKRRQEALDLQRELTKAEIDRIRAQTEALARGDALIQIDGTGLEPELEAFMWQILKRIRVRANAEFSDYLLGMAA